MFRGLVPFNRRGADIARRCDPWGFRNMFEDFFSDSFLPTFFSDSYPIRADIRETDKEFIIDAEIPGVKKEDIKLDLRDNVLTIGVEHNEETTEERKDYIRKERRYGAFSRSFNVENINQEDISAKYDNGILTITLPKSDDRKESGKRIDIQ
ncbi:MAG: Hsp20/alpha crystallin family protein [Acetivibrionales bacterium]|jgi:HSP20 family protein